MNMNKITYEIIFITLLSLVLASSSLGTFQQNTDINLIQTCNNCTYCNITKIVSPNSTVLLSNLEMDKDGTSYSYSLSSDYTSTLGEYKYCYDCGNTAENTAGCVSFEITYNGKPASSGGVITLFIIIFLVLLGTAAYMSIYIIGHLAALDVDMIDLAISLGIYCMILGIYFLQDFYVGNPSIDSILLIFVSVGGIMLVLVPMIAFILSLTIGSLNKKQWKMDFAVPQKFRFRRQR